MQSRERLDSDRKGRLIRFRYDPKDPNSLAFLSLASSYLQGSRFQDAVFPPFPCTPTSRSNTAPLVALSSRPDPQELAQQAISACLGDEGVLVHTEPLGSFSLGGPIATSTLTDPAVWHAMSSSLMAERWRWRTRNSLNLLGCRPMFGILRLPARMPKSLATGFWCIRRRTTLGSTSNIGR